MPTDLITRIEQGLTAWEKAFDVWWNRGGERTGKGDSLIQLQRAEQALRDLKGDCLLALTPQTQGWRPIETAPKDGSYILLWTVDGAGEAREYPAMGVGRYEHYEGGGGGIHGTTLPGQSFYGSMGRATYWMPLPSKPEGPRT